MKILLTGATGFVGSFLARHFLEEGHQVHVLVREHSRLESIAGVVSSLNIHTTDGAYPSVLHAVDRSGAEVVVHVASLFLAAHQSSDVPLLIKSNIEFPTLLLEAMVECGVKRFVNTSTSWQHFEDRSYDPANLYASTKEAFEDVLDYYVNAKGIRAISLALFDTYGAPDPRRKIIQLLRDSLKTGNLLEMSPGEQLLDLVHINDVVTAYSEALRLVSSEDVIAYKYGISSGQRISLKSLVVEIEKATGKKIAVKWGARSYRDREVMNPTRILPSLPRWRPQTSLEQGLKQVFSEERS